MSTNHDDVVRSLLGARWRLYKEIQVPNDTGELVSLDIRCPPPAEAEKLLAEAKRLKDSGKDGEDDLDALIWTRKVVALTVWLPGGLRGCFTVDQVGRWPYMSAALPDCMAALNPAAGIEAAKKN